jgi:hypothetical protein
MGSSLLFIFLGVCFFFFFYVSSFFSGMMSLACTCFVHFLLNGHMGRIPALQLLLVLGHPLSMSADLDLDRLHDTSLFEIVSQRRDKVAIDEFRLLLRNRGSDWMLYSIGENASSICNNCKAVLGIVKCRTGSMEVIVNLVPDDHHISLEGLGVVASLKRGVAPSC